MTIWIEASNERFAQCNVGGGLTEFGVLPIATSTIWLDDGNLYNEVALNNGM